MGVCSDVIRIGGRASRSECVGELLMVGAARKQSQRIATGTTEVAANPLIDVFKRLSKQKVKVWPQ
jgi:hypothetical protein